MSYCGYFAVHVDLLIKEVLVERLMNPYLTKIMRAESESFITGGPTLTTFFFYYLFS